MKGTIDLEGMVRKRHEGPAWIVFQELANSTGGACSRHVDMAALSLWTSHGAFAFHVYELKRSRGDLQKELKDPRKADAIGQYADYFWLVVDDMKITDGIVLPETWGLLAPKDQVLRVVTKAPKLTPKPMTRGFVAAMVRNVTNNWVSRSAHQALREEVNAKMGEERARAKNDAGYELAQLKQTIATFEAKSGVAINQYNCGHVGDAVKIVLDNRDAFGEEMSRAVHRLDVVAKQYEQLASSAREGVKALRALVPSGPSSEGHSP